MKDLTPKYWDNQYKLLDFGNGVKIENFNNVITIRPETAAINKLSKPLDFWQKKANYIFCEETNKWDKTNNENWTINYKSKQINIKLKLNTGNSKHIGIFPEQTANWEFIASKLNETDKVLNLFAYTGGASLVAASKAKSVTHIDSSRSVIKTAIENAKLNKIDNIKFINDDALLFCSKEQKRNNKYNFVILDPPVYGFAGKNKKWKINKDLPLLMNKISQIVSKDAFILLNIYTPQFNEKKTLKLLDETFGRRKKLSFGKLFLTDSFNKKLILNNYFLIQI